MYSIDDKIGIEFKINLFYIFIKENINCCLILLIKVIFKEFFFIIHILFLEFCENNILNIVFLNNILTNLIYYL